jgi:hypothetical protein
VATGAVAARSTDPEALRSPVRQMMGELINKDFYIFNMKNHLE